MDTKQKVKDKRVAKSIMELCQEGYSKTGLSNCKKPHGGKHGWTKETSLISSLLWENRVMIGSEEIGKGYSSYHIKLRNISVHAKRLLENNINTIDFMCMYCPELWDIKDKSEIKVFLKGKEKALVDDAKVLATLIIRRELDDIEPLIVSGNVHGKIKIDNRTVEYSIFRDMKLHITYTMMDISYCVEDPNEMKLMENIYEIGLYGIDEKEDGWKFIKFKYMLDIIGDEELVNNIKKKIFERVKRQLEIHKSRLEGYKTWYLGCVNHQLIPHWDGSNNKLFRMTSTATFERKVEDTRYGVLFRIE